MELLRWMLKNELRYQVGKRPVVLAIIALFAIASVGYAAYSNDIRSIPDLVEFVLRLTVQVYRYILKMVVQYVADVIAGILEYSIEFIFGILTGIISLWKDFELPKISVPKFEI